MAWVFIGLVIVAIFAADAAARWWRQNQWRFGRRDDDNDDPFDGLRPG